MSKGVKQDSLVTWEMWAAFCEIVCQAHITDLSHISAAFVWKRAAKLQSQATSFSRLGETRHLLSSTERRIQDARFNTAQSDSIGCRGSTSPAFCPSHTDSEDIVLSDDDSVLTEDIGQSLYGTATTSYRGGCIRASGQIASSQRCCRQTPVDRIKRSLSYGTSDSDLLGFRGTPAGGARSTHRSFNASPSIAITWPRRSLVTEGLSRREDRKDGHVKPSKREEALKSGVYGSMDHGKAVIPERSCSQKQMPVEGNECGQHHVRVGRGIAHKD